MMTYMEYETDLFVVIQKLFPLSSNAQLEYFQGVQMNKESEIEDFIEYRNEGMKTSVIIIFLQ